MKFRDVLEMLVIKQFNKSMEQEIMRGWSTPPLKIRDVTQKNKKN